jgi:hypothetical protein
MAARALAQEARARAMIASASQPLLAHRPAAHVSHAGGRLASSCKDVALASNSMQQQQQRQLRHEGHCLNQGAGMELASIGRQLGKQQEQQRPRSHCTDQGAVLAGNSSRQHQQSRCGFPGGVLVSPQ